MVRRQRTAGEHRVELPNRATIGPGGSAAQKGETW